MSGPRPLLVLALLLLPAAAEDAPDPAEALASARADLKISRTEFKRLTRVEREALAEARTTVARKARGLAPAFAAAADLLEGVKGEELIAQMAKSYRAMAEEIDKTPPAPEVKARAEALLGEAAAEKDEEPAAAAWRLVKRGDPRYRALAANMKALKEAYETLGEAEGEAAAAVAGALKLHQALEPWFEGVPTERPAPPEPEPECST
jgi:hypothetical protein